jgi:hypothetical protein
MSVKRNQALEAQLRGEQKPERMSPLGNRLSLTEKGSANKRPR